MIRCLKYSSLLFVLALFSCSDIAERIVQESMEKRKRDSLYEYRKANPLATDTFEVVERKKMGNDSFYLVRSFYFNHKKFSEVWFRRNEIHGIAHFYYPSGKICHSINYSNGIAMDLLEAYTPDGEKRTDCVYKNGTGRLKMYHPLTAKLVVDCEMTNGSKNGKYFTWYENGNKKEAGVFRNDILNGNFCSWYKNGIVESRGETDEKTNSITYESFYDKGQIRKKQKQVNGRLLYSKSYDTEGNVIQDHTVNDKGELILVKCAYGENHRLLSRGYYVNELKQGEYLYYHEDGSKKSIEEYRNDTIQSETRWYENGKVSCENKYLLGELHGVQKEYYDNGKPKLVVEYKNGVKDGKYTSYFVNGNLYFDGVYEKGDPGKMKVYTRDGKFKGEYQY